MNIKAGPLKKSVNVFQETIDSSSALEDDVFLSSIWGNCNRQRCKVAPTRFIRHIELRETLPLTWSASVKDLFLVNVDEKGDRTSTLEGKVEILREEVRVSMFENYRESACG